jgi:hypothetical protein
MRPRAIVLFERLYLSGVVLGAAAGLWSVLHIDRMLPPGTPPGMMASMPLITGFSLIGSVAINLLLWFFIARRGATVAKWILIVLFVIGLFGSMRMVIGIRVQVPALMRIEAAIRLLLDAVCVWLLFRPDARLWFKGERPSDLHDIFS